MATLSDAEVQDALAGLDGWELADGQIVRELKLKNFKDAIAFVVRLSYEAEAANHHPDLDIRYNRVRVALSTHDQGGITQNDLDLARTVQDLAG
jgi:4a-hydroxytetrahydrobiopterin dehydratase